MANEPTNEEGEVAARTGRSMKALTVCPRCGGGSAVYERGPLGAVRLERCRCTVPLLGHITGGVRAAAARPAHDGAGDGDARRPRTRTVVLMDPNANLQEQREIVKAVQALEDLSMPDELRAERLAQHASRLAALSEALDGWFTGGGFLPVAWDRRRKA